MGIYTPPEGRRFADLDIEESAVEWALATGRPVVEEVERRPDVIVLVHCIPLLSHGVVTGAMILLRDVTDVRRLDRLLLSKDAAIREVHHRVKNNLQTISSLLRLQSRRMASGEPRSALEEAERRVRSIAVVHEILSRDTVDEVDFNDILPSLIRMAEDLGRIDRPVRITCHGEAGQLHASVATPLAVVITELLQNAAEHGWPDHGAPPDGSMESVVATTESGGSPGDSAASQPGIGEETRLGSGRVLEVAVELRRTDGELRVTVRDNGVGLPPGFSIDSTSGLGLSIVRGLVRTQLGGVISMHGNGGTVVNIVIPVDHATEDLENL
jgi:two-component sensor histidine kinase